MAATRARRAAIGAGIGLAAAALAWIAGETSFVRTIELKTYDLRVRLLTRPAEANRAIALVTIDDGSVRQMEPLVGRWPWPRLAHATVIDFLARARARAIVYDVLFSERDRRSFDVQGEPWTGEESDRALAEAVGRAGNVILAADVSASDPLGDASGLGRQMLARSGVAPAGVFESRPGIAWPFAELATAASGVGHTLLVLDADGPVRHAVPVIRAGGGALPSLAVATALRAAGRGPREVALAGDTLRVGDARVPLVDAAAGRVGEAAVGVKRMLVRFTGPAASESGVPTYREYPFYDLFYSEVRLQRGERPTVDPAVFADGIVLVGTTAAGLHDVFTTPFVGAKMPGVQVHANVVDALLARRFTRPAPALTNVAVMLAGALLLGVVTLLGGVWWGTAATLAAWVALAWLAGARFDAGLWLETARPVLASALSLFGTTAYLYFVEGREKRQVKQVFSRFVSRDVFSQLMTDPARASLGGQRREMSVLFADIRGFTSMTERGRAEDVVAQLNEYFSAMVPVVFAHDGTVDKFVGDLVMALFGAPLDDPDHADHAVQTALAMLDRLDTLNRDWTAAGRPRLGIGVGINSGDMIAGNIGSESIMSYTVIGDAVNLASRLESLNKTYDARIIISDATRARLKGRYDMRPLGSVTVKGKSEPVEIFEVRPGIPTDTGA